MSISEDKPKKARVLCLHGHGQNGDIFRMRTGALRKALSSVAELVYTDAPHVVRDEHGNHNGRAWWHIPSGTGREESVEHLKSVLCDNGPFDGILCFSQGAGMVCHLLAEAEMDAEAGETEASFPKLLFIVLIAGRAPCGVPSAFQTNVHTLHVYGVEDHIIQAHKCIDLASRFSDSRTLPHGGAHGVPSRGAETRAIRNFIADILRAEHSARTE